MATKKSIAKKFATEKTILDTIAEKVGTLAGEIVAGKDHLVEMAGDAIDSVKAKIHNITAPVKKKASPKKPSKTAAKKTVRKAAPVKKETKKSPKATGKKIAAKQAPLKKAAVKSIKKTAPVKKVSK